MMRRQPRSPGGGGSGSGGRFQAFVLIIVLGVGIGSMSLGRVHRHQDQLVNMETADKLDALEHKVANMAKSLNGVMKDTTGLKDKTRGAADLESQIGALQEELQQKDTTITALQHKLKQLEDLEASDVEVMKQEMKALETKVGKAGGRPKLGKPAGFPTPKPGILAIVTSNGNRYMNWQTRICYNSYLRQAKKAGSKFKGFLRLLHRSSDDELMEEVPTVRIPTEHPDCDVWCEYPVADRGPALQKLLEMREFWQYEHVMVIETDYVFVAPFRIPLPAPSHGVAFPFGYITPQYVDHVPIMARHYPGDPADIPGTGNAPVLMRVEDFQRVVPIWSDTTEDIDNDKEAVEKLGWVREMYAYSIASAKAGIKYDMPPVPDNPIMVQPPADDNLGKAVLCHYTWGAILTDPLSGKEVWRWDKREYAQGQYGDKPVVPLLRIPEMPKWQDGGFLTQDKQVFTKGKYDLMKTLVRHFNMAVDDINNNNDGLPPGFNTLEDAAAAARPSDEAVKARAKVEAAKRAAEANK